MTPDQLKQWRDDTGYTVPQMAAFIGVPASTYKNWERGDKAPGTASKRLLRLTKALHIMHPQVLDSFNRMDGGIG